MGMSLFHKAQALWLLKQCVISHSRPYSRPSHIVMFLRCCKLKRYVFIVTYCLISSGPLHFFSYYHIFYQLFCVQHSCSSTQSWGNVYHLLLRRETRIPVVAPFSFQIDIWDLFVNRGKKSNTLAAFGKLWTRRKMYYTCLIIIHDPSMRLGPESNQGS